LRIAGADPLGFVPRRNSRPEQVLRKKEMGGADVEDPERSATP
jgi:hypothetical protein